MEELNGTPEYYQHVANTLLTAILHSHSEDLKNAFSQIRLMNPQEYDQVISAINEIKRGELCN